MPDHPGTFLQIVFIIIAIAALLIFGARNLSTSNPTPAEEFETV